MAKLFGVNKKKSTPDVANEPLETYPTNPSDYKFIGRIGKGAFASVYVAFSKTKNLKCAIKVIELEKDVDPDESNDKEKQINFEEIQKEASIMTRMNHYNIVSCLASFSYKTELWLVMPFMQGGSLSDLMKNSKNFKNGLLDENIVATITKDVLSGVAYCHQDGRVHRDIKAANILLSSNGVAQLSDFGVSGAIIEGGLRKNGRHTFTGSLWWMAPEVLQRENKHSYPADIWSLGITILEISFGKPPHAKQRPVKVMLTILQQDAPTIDSCIKEKDEKDKPLYKNKYGKKMKDFLGKCLQKDPAKRHSAKDLLNHSFLKLSKDAAYIKQNIVKHAHLPKITEDYPRSIMELRKQKSQENKGDVKVEDTTTEDTDEVKVDVRKSADDLEFDYNTSVGKSNKNSVKANGHAKLKKKRSKFTVTVEGSDDNENYDENYDENNNKNKKNVNYDNNTKHELNNNTDVKSEEKNTNKPTTSRFTVEVLD